MRMKIKSKAQGDDEAAGQHSERAEAENSEQGVADGGDLRRLARDESGKLQHNADQHHRARLGGFARQRHDAGKDAFATLTGERIRGTPC